MAPGRQALPGMGQVLRPSGGSVVAQDGEGLGALAVLVVLAVLAVVALQVSVWHLGHIKLSKISFLDYAVRAVAYRLPDL